MIELNATCDTCGKRATHIAHDVSYTTDYPLRHITISSRRYRGCDDHSVKAGRFWYVLHDKETMTTLISLELGTEVDRP